MEGECGGSRSVSVWTLCLSVTLHLLLVCGSSGGHQEEKEQRTRGSSFPGLNAAQEPPKLHPPLLSISKFSFDFSFFSERFFSAN